MNNHNPNLTKKSKWGIMKKEFNLYKKVATLSEAKSLIKYNQFPLIIELTETEKELINNSIIENKRENNYIFNLIIENYNQTHLLPNNDSVSHFVLDSQKIEQNFYSNKIYLNKIISKNGEVTCIYNLYQSTKTSPTRIGIIKDKKLFIKEKDIEIISLPNLIKKTSEKYITMHKNKINLSQEEIDEIHARGNLTPEEIIEEWDSLGLCVLGDNSGTIRNRCKKFDDCHECLTDYAYRFREHPPIKHLPSSYYNPTPTNYSPKQLIKKK